MAGEEQPSWPAARLGRCDKQTESATGVSSVTGVAALLRGLEARL